MSKPAPVRVAVGCDQAGVELKAVVIEELLAAGFQVQDHSEDPALDYPDAADAVARSVAGGQAHRGVLICGTGIGMSITANKVEGVRAALCADPYSARMSREHNDANVLCLGGRTLGSGPARDIIRAWIEAPVSSEERHVRRRDKITAIERTEG